MLPLKTTKEERSMKSFSIYFSDLNEDAQKRLLELLKTTPEEENWDTDVFPIAILDREDE